MKTEDLIQKLSSNLSPVKRIFPLHIIYSAWILFSFLISIIFIASRTENFKFTHIPQYYYDLIPISLVMFSSAFAAIHFSIPGNRIKKSFFYLPISLLLAWTILVSARYNEGIKFLHSELTYHSCAKDIFLISLPSASVLFYIINKRVPVLKKWIGFWILSSSGSAAAMTVAFLCPNEASSHLLVVHFVPVFLLCLIGVILGEKILRDV
jgi:hypothetical protein